MATIVNVSNAFDMSVRTIEQGIGTISLQFQRLQLAEYPTIAILNGKITLRKNWGHLLDKDDLLTFVRLPADASDSDGASDALRVVAMLVVAYYTIGGGAGWLTGAGSLTGATGISAALIGAGAAAAGGALVNALLPPPKPSDQAQNYNRVQPSPTYSAEAQGNSARLGAAIPVIYGRTRVFPDYATQPHHEYVNNEVILYQTFVIGQGNYQVSDIKYGKNPITGFPKTEATLYGLGRLPPEKLVTKDVNVSNQDINRGGGVVPLWANVANLYQGKDGSGGSDSRMRVLRTTFNLKGQGKLYCRLFVLSKFNAVIWEESHTHDFNLANETEYVWTMERTDWINYGTGVRFLIGGAFVEDASTVTTAEIVHLVVNHGNGFFSYAFRHFKKASFDESKADTDPTRFTLGEASDDNVSLVLDCLPPVLPHMIGNVRQVTQLHIHLIAPRGLYSINEDGKTIKSAVLLKVHYQKSDETRVQTQSFLIAKEPIQAVSLTSTLRWTKKIDVPLGNYSVFLTRKKEYFDPNRAHSLHWQGLSGTTTKTLTNAKLMYLTVKSQVTKTISETASRRLNLVAVSENKKLIVDPANNTHWVDNLDNNPVWSAVDLLKNVDYGAGLTDLRFNLDELRYLAGVCDANNEEFNAVFDTADNLANQLQSILRCARSVAIWQGGKVRFIRDEKKTVSVAMFTEDNITKDSLQMSYLLPNESTPGIINLGYLDDEEWINKRVVVAESGATKESRVEFFGCTKKNQAVAEADYLSKSNKYRRRLISFDTGMEGFIPTYGDLIIVSHELPRWGESGVMLGYDAITKRLWLSKVLRLDHTKDYYINIRQSTGAGFDVTLKVELVLLSYIGIVGTLSRRTEAMLQALVFDSDNPVLFMFGDIETIKRRIRVTSTQIQSLNKIRISGVVDDERVFT